MANKRYYEVTLKTGEIFDFDKKCHNYSYSEKSNVFIFNQDYHEIPTTPLMAIPYDNVKYIKTHSDYDIDGKAIDEQIKKLGYVLCIDEELVSMDGGDEAVISYVKERNSIRKKFVDIFSPCGGIGDWTLGTRDVELSPQTNMREVYASTLSLEELEVFTKKVEELKKKSDGKNG